MVLSHNFRSKKKQTGFTLIEILIVIGILTIIAGITISAYLNLSQRRDFNSYLRQTVANIEEARDRAKTEGKNYGLYFETEFCQLFQGDNYAEGDKDIRLNLGSGLTYSEIGLPDNQIVFEAGTGEVINYQSGQDSIILSSSENATISINQLGVIDVNP